MGQENKFTVRIIPGLIALSLFTLTGCEKKEEATTKAETPPTQVQAKATPASAPQQPDTPTTTQLYWGDTHLHTNYSGDAYALLTTTADPDTSYRFAKGLPVVADLNRSRVQIETPLDFLVVTDHAEFMGVLPEIAKGNELLLNTKFGPDWKKKLEEGRGGEVFFEIIKFINTNPAALAEMNSEAVRNSVWSKIVDAAERHNDPGKFTAFIGWEWSSLPEGRNLHRILFTPDGKDKALKYLPYSALDSTRPRDLWDWMAKTAQENQTDFVAIAHNMNISGGTMFPFYDEYGKAVDMEYAEKRMRWEPVEEVTQYKGDSETHASLSPDDQFANYETYEHAISVGVEVDHKVDEG